MAAWLFRTRAACRSFGDELADFLSLGTFVQVPAESLADSVLLHDLESGLPLTGFLNGKPV